MKHEDFLKTLKSDPVTFTEQAKVNDRRFQIAQTIRERTKNGEKVEVMAGVFGEWKGCDGIVEKIIKPPEGGLFTQLYGCTYLFKGHPDTVRVHGLELAKSLISQLPRNLIGKSKIYLFAIGIKFLFFRRAFIHDLDVLFDEITTRSLLWYTIPAEEYNTAVRAMKVASIIVIAQKFGIPANKQSQAVHVNDDFQHIDSGMIKKKKEQFGYLLARICNFICLFLESDSAYRFRVQDAFGNLKKQDGIKMFFEGLEILIKRETQHGIAHKWKFLKMGIRIGFFLSPSLRLFVKSYFEQLDTKKIAMDESDWYFCLRWISYDFGGKDKEWRFAERDRIDKEKGHIFLL